MLRTTLLLASAALAHGQGTFVASFKHGNAALFKEIAETKCASCKTDHGNVDMWDPEVDPAQLPPTWRGEIHVRGGQELRQMLEKHETEFIHEDWEAHERAERERIASKPKISFNASADDWFSEFRTYAEIRERLGYYVQEYQGVQMFDIGTTDQGQLIEGIKFGTPKNNHTVWIQCGIHAREWIAPVTCMYFTEQLLKNYGKDAEVTNILDSAEIYMIPSLNRDGYEFSWSTTRMWRKNRQPNPGNNNIGTDLNRNWDSSWGGCGASTRPASDTYRGAGPFSGTEAARVRDYFRYLKAQGRHILGGHDFHSYGNLLLRPYGWTAADSPNEAVERTRGRAMVEAIQSTYGQVYTNQKAYDLYCCSGLACDWIADQTVMNSGFTFELRGRSFAPPASDIVPSGQEIYAAMLVWFNSILQ